jgi:iron complex transport system substrate-binding protein
VSKRLKNAVTWLLLLAVLAVGLVGCGPEEEAMNLPIEIEDQLGRVVRLEKVPERIISLAPSNTEILFALGLGERVVGVTEYCDYPVEAKEKEQVGGFSTPDIEKIVSLDPDLILAVGGVHAAEVIPELERRGLPVVALYPGNLAEVIEAITLAGTVSGNVAEAEELVGDMQTRIDQVTSLTKGLPAKDRLRVFYILWHDPLMSVGNDKLLNEIIELAGGKNIFDDCMEYPMVDLEIVLERDPEVIVADSGHGAAGDTPFYWATTEPRLSGTSALKQGNVYEIDADLVTIDGPRIVQGLEKMLQFIHPELYEKL